MEEKFHDESVDSSESVDYESVDSSHTAEN